jgi:alanine racemase
MADLGHPMVKQLQVATLLSHLACADEDNALNALQHERWEEARQQVPARDTSLANSAGIMLGPDYHGSLTRPGLSLYGGIPRSELAQHIKPVVKPQAVIMQVRHVSAGESIGYNATFTARSAMRLGVVAIGYADGYLRAWSGKGTMRSGDHTLPVLGRVSMDMTVVDLTHAPQAGEGDWLDLAYDLPSAAETSGLSQYELLTLLGQRFTR